VNVPKRFDGEGMLVENSCKVLILMSYVVIRVCCHHAKPMPWVML